MNIGKASVIGALLSLSSCNYESPVISRVNEYMADKPRTEVEQVIQPYTNRFSTSDDPRVCYSECQSKLDSVAYRDLFETTTKKNDSTAVAEFNQIAGKNRITNYYKVKDKLAQTGVSNKEYKEIVDKGSIFAKLEEYERGAYFQHKTDSIAYDKFFKKHNLLDDAMTKKIMQVTKKIAPKL